MMKRLFTLLLCAGFGVATALAVPAKPVKKLIRLSDGRQVLATLGGDEAFSFYRLEDGTKVSLQQDGTYSPVSQQVISERQQAWMKPADMNRGIRRAKAKANAAANTGVKKQLILLVSFTDQPFSVSSDAHQTYEDFFNKPGYKDFGMEGSVQEYFRDQSYGALDIQFDVVGPIAMPHGYAYYGENDANGGDLRAAEMVAEACKMVDAQVNFRDYDWDGDGEVEQVFVIYAGYAASAGAGDDRIWPHQYQLQYRTGKIVLDNTIINSYACANELDGKSGNVINGIGTFCHEFSHCLGLMDAYDTQGSGYGIGNWDIMSNGCYNNNSCTPAGYSAYERWSLGWLEPTEISKELRVTDMAYIGEKGEAYVLYNDANRNEFYVLENRQLQKWDAYLPGHGMLVMHVDYDPYLWVYNQINVDDARPRMSIVPADGIRAVSNEANDLYPGPRRVTRLTDTTSPAATVLFNENVDGRKFLDKPITDIAESAKGLISFVAMKGYVPAFHVNAPAKKDAKSFLLSWDAVDGAVSYEILLSEKRAASNNPADVLIFDEDFSKCKSAKVGMGSIAKKLDDYLLNPGWTGEQLFTSPNLLQMGKGNKLGTLASPSITNFQAEELSVYVRLAPLAGTSSSVTTYLHTNGKVLSTSIGVSSDQAWVIHTGKGNVQEDLSISFAPSSVCYIKEFAIYDGSFTTEQIEASRANGGNKVVRRAAAQRLASETNEYLFKDMNPTSEYTLRVRAVMGEGFSAWSPEVKIDMAATGDAILLPKADTEAGAYYDLQGRRIETPTKSGIYIRNGKKVFVR